MTTSKSLLVAALLTTFAAVSFAQSPAAQASPERGAAHRHHHKHHGHHHHHKHGVKAPHAR